MKFVSTAICGFLTITAATALRKNSSNNDNKNDNTHDNRRHLAPGTDCVPFIRVMHYEDGHMEDNWFCEFNDVAAALSGLGNSGSQMIELDVDEQKMKEKGAVSGGCLLTVGRSSYIEAIDDEESITAQKDNVFGSRSQGNSAPQKFVLHVSANEDFAIETMDEDTDVRHSKYHSKRRKLADKTGTLNTLVVRVADSNGVAAEFTKQEVYDNVFDDTICLKSQYAACSYDKIIIDPAQSLTLDGISVNGVVDISIDAAASEGYGQMQNKAESKAKETFGGNLNDFDLVMYCQPQSGSDWIAYAYINDYRSFFNNQWCKSVSVHMHEVGHNLGLHHSGITGRSEYEDKTGMMGYSYLQDDGPEMCFNAAKSYQLGWYTGATDDVDPRSLPGGSQNFKLNGVADYSPNGDGLVSLRLLYTGTSNGGEDYYVGYNRATSMNRLTQSEPNKVHLYRKESDGQSIGLSWRMATLDENEIYTWNVGNTAVTLEVTSIDGADALVTLTGGVAPVSPTASPVTPTANPTAATKSPTRIPTASPVIATTDPTVATKSPTRIPTASPVIATTDPTAATKSPTRIPTASPVIPTANPTAAQIDGCSDDPAFKWKGQNNKNCAWVAKKKGRRCPKSDGNGSVMDACPVTCTNPACTTNPDPTSAPIPDPTSAPIPDATSAPISDPTPAPIPNNQPCSDDPDYRLNNNNRLSCKYIGNKEKRQKRHCNKNDGEPIERCPIACNNPQC